MLTKEQAEALKELDDTDFNNWVEHPISKLLLQAVKKRSESAKEALLRLEFSPEGVNRMLFTKGEIAGYRLILTYDYDNFNYLRNDFLEANNDSSNRYNNSGGDRKA